MKAFLKLGAGALLSLGGLAVQAGDWSSGGGDAVAVEFSAIGYQVAGYLRELERDGVKKLGLKSRDFLKIVEDTRVVSSAKPLVWNGAEVDAINHPGKKLIEVSRARWKDNEGRNGDKLALVMHEYLGIAKVDDRKYQTSHKLRALFAQRGLTDTKDIVCKSFGEAPADLGPLTLLITNRGAYNARLTYVLPERHDEVDDNVNMLVERFARETPPRVNEIYALRSPLGDFFLDARIQFDENGRSHSSAVTMSDFEGATLKRAFWNWQLSCELK
jgi:hypothetical protein